METHTKITINPHTKMTRKRHYPWYLCHQFFHGESVRERIE